jgi:hypothetical protein
LRRGEELATCHLGELRPCKDVLLEHF